MNGSTDTIIMCGGKGRRMGNIVRKYGCKSLIPLGKSPALEYVLREIKRVELNKIFLCVDREELLHSIKQIVGRVGVKRAEFYIDKGLGTMNALYELQDSIQSKKVFVLFGHHLITSRHLQKMVQCMSWSKDIVLSLLRASSDDLRKIMKPGKRGECLFFIKGDENSRLKDDEYYADVPYLVSREFINLRSGIPIRSFDAIKTWFDAGKKVWGVKADFPHEFHVIHDLRLANKFAAMLIHSPKRRKRGEKTSDK